METIAFEGQNYPAFQANGNAAQYIMPIAKEFCSGYGYDIGCNNDEWKMPEAIPIDLTFDDEWDAANLPDGKVDYIFSSHCLEHLNNWVEAIEYWTTKIKTGGSLFLYLPSYTQRYWRPWNNRKHKSIMDPQAISDLMVNLEYTNIYLSGIDLNNSFSITGEKS